MSDIRIIEGTHRVRDVHRDHINTCIVCLRGCDTCIGALGDVPWLVHFLKALGVPSGEAEPTMRQIVSMRSGDDERHHVQLTLCQVCADNASNERLTLQLGRRGDRQGPTLVQDGDIPADVFPGAD